MVLAMAAAPASLLLADLPLTWTVLVLSVKPYIVKSPLWRAFARSETTLRYPTAPG